MVRAANFAHARAGPDGEHMNEERDEMLVCAVTSAIVAAAVSAALAAIFHRRRTKPPLSIHVEAIELKPAKEPPPMTPPTDHMPPLNLPASTLRALLSVVDPRKADGSRVTAVSWNTSDAAQLPLEAVADSTVKIPDPTWVDPDPTAVPPNVAPLIDKLDAVDGLPLLVFKVYANTPLDAGSGLVTVGAEGMADADVQVTYSDPPVGHFAITAVQAAE